MFCLSLTRDVVFIAVKMDERNWQKFNGLAKGSI